MEGSQLNALCPNPGNQSALKTFLILRHCLFPNRQTGLGKSNSFLLVIDGGGEPPKNQQDRPGLHVAWLVFLRFFDRSDMDISRLSLWERVELVRVLLSVLSNDSEFQHLKRKISLFSNELLASQIAAKKLKF